MHDALHSAFLLSLNGNHEAFAANRDQVLLRRATFGEPPQKTTQRILDGTPLCFNLPANAGKLRRGTIFERAVGKNLIAEAAQEFGGVRNGRRKLLHRCPVLLHPLRRIESDLAPFGCSVHSGDDADHFQTLKRSA